MRDIFLNFNFIANNFSNQFGFMPMNFSMPSFFMTPFTNYPNFNLPITGSLFSTGAFHYLPPPTVPDSIAMPTVMPPSMPALPKISPTAPTLTTKTETPLANPTSKQEAKPVADNPVGNVNYDPDTLKDLRNASILKNVPEARKNAILGIVDKAAKKYNVNPKLILSVISAESSFNPNARSKCGAMGLMQLMPGTAQEYGATNPYDMEQNIFAGTKYLAKLLKKYNGNVKLAVAAYNAGPGRVKDAVPKIRETQNYVVKVTNNLNSLA